MRVLSATECLAVWERGYSQRPVQRALTLLAAACPKVPHDALANLPIGRRDALLLGLRERTFGPQLTGLADCPACRAQMEMTFSVAELHAAETPHQPAEIEMQLEGYHVRFRLPNSDDVLAVVGDDSTAAYSGAVADAAGRRERLLDRCLLAADGALPACARDALVKQLEQADPLANIRLALSCTACGHAWEATFDIVSFFWREISSWARGLLRDIHTLAAAYGWTESEILALSPERRQAYLEMVTA